MPLAARVREKVRKRLTRWVEKERALTGCAKTAIKRISGKIGMSKASLYRVMNGYGEVRIQAHQYVALLMHTVLPKRRRLSKPAAAADFAFPQNEISQAWASEAPNGSC